MGENYLTSRSVYVRLKNIQRIFLCLTFLFCSIVLKAQTFEIKNNGQFVEDLWYSNESEWEQTLLGILAVDQAGLRQFFEYNNKVITKDKRRFFNDCLQGDISTENAAQFFVGLTGKYSSLYNEFIKLKKENPAVIDASIKSRHTPAQPHIQGICNPGCSNIGFQNGTLSSWSAYWGIAQSTVSSLNVSNWTGGPCASVTKDAYDANTSTYQVSLMTALGSDPIDPAISLTPPLGGIAAMVGDGQMNMQGVGRLEQTFTVNASNPILTLQYAVLLENPGHQGFAQPWFQMQVLDQNNNVIPGCGNYFIVASSNLPGFKPNPYGGDTVYSKGWTTAFVPLYSYIGQCVTVQFIASDCAYGGHIGYAYVAATCSKIDLVSSSTIFCVGQKSATITGPPGAASYQWSTTGGCISGSSTQQVLTVTCGGTYSLVTTASAGPQCVDTFSITIPNSPAGPPPVPCFTADTVCSGTPTQLNANCSNPNTGAKFYWDFYNSGQYQDSSGTTPAWTYTSGGYYFVKLHQVSSNGCSADTVIKIQVDSANVYAIPKATVSTTDATGCGVCDGKMSLKISLSGVKIGITISNSCNPSFIKFTPPWTYNMNGNGCSSSLSSTTGAVLTCNNVCPGTCYWYVYPTNPVPPSKCSPGGFVGDTIIANISVAGVNITTNINTSPATCGNNNGSVSVTGTGGSVPYTYNWSSGLGTDQSVTGLAAGTYTVTIRDAAGCTGSTVIKIASTPQLSANVTPYYVTCFGANDGSLKVTPIGGASPYSYSWSPNVSISDSAGGLAPGTYTVIVTDAGGCSGTVTANIIQPAQITNNITGNFTNLPCFSTGDAKANPSGGYPPYTYYWNNGVNTQTDTGLVAGTYSVTITDANGCTSRDSVKVTSTCSSVPVAVFNSSDTTFCNEGGLCIDFFDQSANNPTGWKWLFPGAFPDTSTTQNPTGICYFIPGTYAVTLIVTNGAGTDTLTVSPMITFGNTPPAPIITRIGDTLVCSQASAYQWFFNGVPINGATNSFYVAVNDGNYNVYITDSLGCNRLGNSFLFVPVKELTNGTGIRIYPNPAANLITITGDRLKGKNVLIEIYNVLGEKIYVEKFQQSSFKIDLDISSISKGLYFLNTAFEDSTIVRDCFVIDR